MNEVKMKVCKECKEEFPMNTDYFFKKKDTEDGYANKCKKCQGYKFTDKLTKTPKEGYRFCIKCGRELPSNSVYFPVDKTCKNGLRNVCRECGKDGHFMDDDYIPKRVWSDDENNIFINRYPYYTNEELIEKFYPDETLKTLQCRIYRLGYTNVETDETRERRFQSHSLKVSGENSPFWGIPKSKETKMKISIANKKYYSLNPHPRKGKKMTNQQKQAMSEWNKIRGKWVGKNNPRYKDPLYGKRNGNWKGGITPLYFELRSETRQWQLDSMERCNYKCVVTNSEFHHIHHLYPFRSIVDEVFQNLKLDQRKKVEDYSELEFNKVKNELHKLHNKYGYGVCLNKNIHKLFHDLYGYTNNTPEQFKEFKIRYRVGEFDKI